MKERVPHQPGIKNPPDIRERSFRFAVRIVRLCKYLEHRTRTSKNLSRQLLKAGTSIGANLEEAQAAQSKADFIHKNSISLKEARETTYWLRLILSTEGLDKKTAKGIEELENESKQLALIIGKIIVNAKR